MSKKRDIGTPFWQKSRQMWRLKIECNGEKKWFGSTVRGAAGRRAVERKAQEWIEMGSSETEYPTVREAFAAWLEETLQNAELASYRAQESIGRLYILPIIGDMHVNELTAEQPFQDIINNAYTHSAQGKRKLARATLVNIRGVITGFLRFCRKNGWTTLRIEFVDLPKRARRTDKQILQPNELRTLFSSEETVRPYQRVATGPDDLIHMYRFHVLTGLRPGELIGLQWDDIQDGWVAIRRSINYHGEITPGKTANARRSFCLPPMAAAELEAQRRLLDEWGMDSPYVFPDPETGKPISHKKYRRRLMIYCRHNGLRDLTPYELRHTWYSMNKTLPTELVKQMGGHSRDMDTFGVYGHEVDGEAARFAQMLDDVMHRLLGDD